MNMSRKITTTRKAVTVIELMLAIIFLGLVVLTVGMVLADSHRGWSTMYHRVYSDVVTEGHIARRVFDSTIRKASRNHILVDSGGAWVQVRYYQDLTSVVLDRYARFYTSGNELLLEYGASDSLQPSGTRTICSNVSSCVFSRVGKSVQMVLKLDNGSETAAVVTSAVAHN
ncbi:MAG: hypothetical protein ACYTEQ_02375 [Planctomycetota bacterium]